MGQLLRYNVTLMGQLLVTVMGSLYCTGGTFTLTGQLLWWDSYSHGTVIPMGQLLTIGQLL